MGLITIERKVLEKNDAIATANRFMRERRGFVRVDRAA